MKIVLAVAAGAGLFLLFACTQHGYVTATPTDTPSPVRILASAQATSSVPVDTALSGSASTIPLPGIDPSHSIRSGGNSGTTAADLAIKVQTPHRAAAGATTIYTLTVHNHGPAPATGVVLTDVLPVGVIPSWTQAARPLCRRQESAVGCNLGALKGGDAATVTLDLSIAGTDAVITSTQLAGVTWDLYAPMCYLSPNSSAPYVVCQLARLPHGATVDLRVGARVDIGFTGMLVHTATVTANEFDADRSSNRALVTMTVGASTPLAFSSVPTATDLVLRTDVSQTIVAGQPFTYTFTITNRGPLDANGVTLQTPLPPATELRAYRPDLPPCEQIEDMLSCHFRTPDGGAPVTLTLAITGHADVPMSLHLDPLSTGWPVCGIVKERSYLDILNCNLGSLKRGEKTQVQLVLIARGVRARTLSNTAVVNAEEVELNALDNTNTITIAVRVQADLAIRPLISAPLVAGKHMSFTFTIANDGPSDAHGVLFSDFLPPTETVVSAVPSQGEGCQIDGSTNRAICNMGRLDSGVTATITVVAVAGRLAATVAHTVHVLSEQDDPNLTNNDWIGSIPVDAEAAP